MKAVLIGRCHGCKRTVSCWTSGCCVTWTGLKRPCHTRKVYILPQPEAGKPINTLALLGFLTAELCAGNWILWDDLFFLYCKAWEDVSLFQCIITCPNSRQAFPSKRIGKLCFLKSCSAVQDQVIQNPAHKLFVKPLRLHFDNYKTQRYSFACACLTWNTLLPHIIEVLPKTVLAKHCFMWLLCRSPLLWWCFWKWVLNWWLISKMWLHLRIWNSSCS